MFSLCAYVSDIIVIARYFQLRPFDRNWDNSSRKYGNEETEGKACELLAAEIYVNTRNTNSLLR